MKKAENGKSDKKEESGEEDNVVFEEDDIEEEGANNNNSEDEDGEDNLTDRKRENTSSLEACRFYQNELPSPGDLIMVEIKGCNEYCGVVYMLEYAKKEAMIQFSELSNRRLRVKPSKILREGKQEVMQVLKVDTDRSLVDVTRKNLDPTEVEECSRKYGQCKIVHSVLHTVSTTLNIPLKEFYQKMVWLFVESTEEQPIELFKQIYKDESVLDQYKLDDSVKPVLKKLIAHKLVSHDVKVQATIEVTCYAYEGIDAIKSSLTAGTTVPGVKINLIAPPLYAVYTLTSTLDEGVQLIGKAITCIKQEIEKRQGNLTIQREPSLISA